MVNRTTALVKYTAEPSSKQDDNRTPPGLGSHLQAYKGWLTQKKKNLSLCTPPCSVSNLYDFLLLKKTRGDVF